MLRILGSQSRLCDGISRREMLRVGGLATCGVGLDHLLRSRERSRANAAPPTTASIKAKSCLVLFLMGGPPTHSTWDPKTDAPAEVRGEFGAVNTAVPGIQISELFPRTSLLTDKLAILRAISSGDNAHSSSGYYMLTGVPHAPQNVENANPGFPNNYPNLGAIIRKFVPERGSLPASIRLPHRIFNTDGSVWPGQDAGFLGHHVEPWLLNCKPATKDDRVSELSLNADVSDVRLLGRHSLLDQLNRRIEDVRSGHTYDRLAQQAFDMLGSPRARNAFQLDHEPDALRDRYGRTHFGQSVLLGRRLIEAGVSLVHVNWYRGADEPSDAPCWDSHARESQRLKTVLAPPADQALSAVIEDLAQRGLLDETLVVCMAEFGRTPRFNGAAGRDHWGSCYSAVLAGAGIKGGTIFGASDAIGAYPAAGKVSPADITATIFHCLGLDPMTEIQDPLGRPTPISRGDVIRAIVT